MVRSACIPSTITIHAYTPYIYVCCIMHTKIKIKTFQDLTSNPVRNLENNFTMVCRDDMNILYPGIYHSVEKSMHEEMF